MTLDDLKQHFERVMEVASQSRHMTREELELEYLYRYCMVELLVGFMNAKSVCIDFDGMSFPDFIHAIEDSAEAVAQHVGAYKHLSQLGEDVLTQIGEAGPLSGHEH